MNISLPLSSMTTAEKLLTMETLWDDLCRQSDALPSPFWHGDLLKERDNRLKEGNEQVYDWADAKGNIRKDLG